MNTELRLGTDEAWLIDTNILVYAYDEADTNKHSTAIALLKAGWQGRRELFFTLQNLCEFFNIVTGKIARPLNPLMAKDVVMNLLQAASFKKLHYTENSMLLAMQLTKDYKMDFWDCLIVAVMKENDVNKIYTEDAYFKKIPWLKVVNPFKTSVR